MIRFLTTALGVLSALIVGELALRPFATGLRVDTKPPTYLTPRGELRQYQEGVATAHYDADGARRTGGARIATAPNVLVVGDSQVEAVQVEDAETMGAVLERRARASGTPWNVVQLGWGGAAVPTYIGVATDVLSKWSPSAVVVVLNPRDFGPESVRAGSFKMSLAADQTVHVEDVGTKTSAGLLKRALQHSRLGYMLWLRGKQIRSAGGDAAGDDEAAPQPAKPSATPIDTLATASVRGLKQAYGDRLAIVFTPYIGVGASPATAEEPALLRACEHEHVRCASARDAMIAARNADHVLARGFRNTAPGVGHFNADGHALVAGVIWDLTKAR